MKLSKNTLGVLRNFAGINQSVVLPEDDNTLRTCSPQRTVVAAVVVDESFPMRVGVYDLNQFLSTLSLFDEPELDFKDSHVVIKSGRKRSKYYYTDPKMITCPPDHDLKMPKVPTTFSLPAKSRTAVMKAASTLQVENVIVEASEKGVTLIARDERNKTSNTFEEKAEEFSHEGKDKKYVFRVENLKMMDLDYEVFVTDEGIAMFKGAEGSARYWVATEK